MEADITITQSLGVDQPTLLFLSAYFVDPI